MFNSSGVAGHSLETCLRKKPWMNGRMGIPKVWPKNSISRFFLTHNKINNFIHNGTLRPYFIWQWVQILSRNDVYDYFWDLRFYPPIFCPFVRVYSLTNKYVQALFLILIRIAFNSGVVRQSTETSLKCNNYL